MWIRYEMFGFRRIDKMLHLCLLQSFECVSCSFNHSEFYSVVLVLKILLTLLRNIHGGGPDILLNFSNKLILFNISSKRGMKGRYTNLIWISFKQLYLKENFLNGITTITLADYCIIHCYTTAISVTKASFLYCRLYLIISLSLSYIMKEVLFLSS